MMRADPCTFRPGDYIELSKDINRIPQGIYRLDCKDVFVFWFRIEKRVVFAISREGLQFMKRIESIKGSQRRTPYEEFEQKYQMLAASTEAASGIFTTAIFFSSPTAIGCFAAPTLKDIDILH